MTTGVPVVTPKSYGKSIKPSDLPEGFARFFVQHADGRQAPSTRSNDSEGNVDGGTEPSARHGTGLPSDLLIPILRSLREDVAEIRDALSLMHIRMVGASLLIIYEADWDRCREGVQKFLVDGEDEEAEDDEDDEDDDGSGDEAAGTKPRPPYVVKLIDFAHTRIVPGQGPDEGVLTGLKTVLNLIDGRIQELEALTFGGKES